MLKIVQADVEGKSMQAAQVCWKSALYITRRKFSAACG